MATIGFSDEQLKVINSLRDKLSLNGIATIDAYHAIFFVTSTFTRNHAESLDNAGLYFDLTASNGYMVLDIMKQS
ncbi:MULTISPECIES: hypothetical protein [Bacteroides]|jgi:hypothetical protein|uniref:Uncharacterized protein n=1 Tax=Bacteroides fragilis TaxID=817 RepID=A0A0I9SAS6_BACFG|nr:hypothetical protein [Bacteroides fragilis]DAZ13160.1 MAG TPA: hypothetical protein [Caudoviricetes sp.]MCE8567185.1 hypothetical protein [Bacteroides fragilis]MCM0197269.1 hypothetical protein [Bacteroides fragilis]MCM0198146.1 hypothetical protein [Bacteroides fragilis]MCM0208497.1 hypothetical protein [Bacteroides fragilis]